MFRACAEKRSHIGKCWRFSLTYGEILEKGHAETYRDVCLFLKRLRRRGAVGKFRYFATFENGKINGRPHWHGALYCAGLRTRRGEKEWELVQSHLHRAWKLGFVGVDRATDRRLGYTLKYVVKESPKVWGSVGLGSGYYKTLLQQVREETEEKGLSPHVPHLIRFGKRRLPIPENWRRKLRGDLGVVQPPNILHLLYKGVPDEAYPDELTATRIRSRSTDETKGR